jgi:hypothetical protein
MKNNKMIDFPVYHSFFQFVASFLFCFQFFPNFEKIQIEPTDEPESSTPMIQGYVFANDSSYNDEPLTRIAFSTSVASGS